MPVPRHRPQLSVFHLSIVTIAFLTALFGDPTDARADSFLLVATYDGVITPVSAEYFHDALQSAQEGDAEALILRLNTPGGLDTSMRLMIKDITASNHSSGRLCVAVQRTGRLCRRISHHGGTCGGDGSRHKHRRGPSGRDGRRRDG